jgi:hypothetical protein
MPAGAKKPVYAPYVEHVPPDTTAAIFWLKNRDRPPQGGHAEKGTYPRESPGPHEPTSWSSEHILRSMARIRLTSVMC